MASRQNVPQTQKHETPTKSLPVHETDTNILFEKFTIEEIRAIEKKTRTDIERKKEDLRTMVGERYRDLIEAADTITEMKNSAQNVMKSIAKIDDLCKQLNQSHMVRGTSFHQRSNNDMDLKRKQEVKFHGVASQIKLLLDVPEKVWSALDRQDYLTSTRHYLLSRHIHTSLQLDSQQSPNLLSWFPVLTRQWAAISHFRATILQGCRLLLKEPAVSDQQIAESLCTIILLEDSTPRQVFNEFLLARTTAVQQLFHQQNVSVKEQICTVVKLITTTVHQIHSVFYQGESSDKGGINNLLVSILTKVTSQKQHETGLLDFHQSSSLKSLPKSVLDFCPTLRSHASPVSVQYLQDNCLQWVETCVRDVKLGVGKLLSFVNTVKRLADIRDAVWDLLANDSSLSGWEDVCKCILNKPLSIWKDFLWPLFIERVKILIKYQLDSATELTKRHVSKVVMEIGSVSDGTSDTEVDLSQFIWTESAGDLQANMAWTTASIRTSTRTPGGLLMKAKGYTPVIQSLCRNYDERLHGLIEDSQHYIEQAEQTNSEDPEPFDRFSDSADLTNHLKVTCHRCLEELLIYLDEQQDLWKLSLAEIPDRTTNQITTNKILLVGRFCGALCELVPSLQQCIVGRFWEKSETGKFDRKMISSRSGSKVTEDPIWQQIKDRLVQCNKNSYRLWVDYLSSTVLKDFKSSLNARPGKDAIGNCTRWDEVDIQEETEEGKTISSKIRVPMQASWYLQDLMFHLCQEINRVGGHTVHRKTLEELVARVSDGIMDSYEEVIAANRKKKTGGSQTLSQQMALQLIFDVKFMLHIMPRKDEQQDSKLYQQRSQRVVERLEEKVDPFDLDVFTPYINSHLMKQAQRSTILYGALTSLDRLGLYSSGRPVHSTQQEQHNVLPLTTCQNRFVLLPLSTQTSSSMLPQSVVTQSIQRSAVLSGSSLTEKAAAVLPQTSSNKDMTSSFYNKLGSMSSMSELSSWFSNIGSSK